MIRIIYLRLFCKVAASKGKVAAYYDYKFFSFLVHENLIERRPDGYVIDQSVKNTAQEFIHSLRFLSPRRIRTLSSLQESYGTESKRVKNIDTLDATDAQGTGDKP